MRAQIVRLAAQPLPPRPPPKGGGLGGVDFSSLSEEQLLEIDLESLKIKSISWMSSGPNSGSATNS